MGFNNPSVPWSEMERLLSDRRRPSARPAGADGGDSPAWSHKRGPYVARFSPSAGGTMPALRLLRSR